MNLFTVPELFFYHRMLSSFLLCLPQYFSPYLRRKIANLVASQQAEGISLNPEVAKAVRVMYESVQPLAALENLAKRPVEADNSASEATVVSN